MFTESRSSKMTGVAWLAVLLALVVGIGIGAALDRFAFSRALNLSDTGITIFEQSGPLEGHRAREVHFPLPYASPPNVDLKTTSGLYVIVETTANALSGATTAFRFKDRVEPGMPKV